MLYIRFLPLITSVVVLFFLELFFFYPKAFYVSLALAGLSIFFAVWQFARISFIYKKWWNFLILPLILTIAGSVYSLTIFGNFIIQILFIVIFIFIYFYLRFSYYYLAQPALFKEFIFENISSYGNFLAFFFAAAAVYSLQSFLNIPVWLLMIALLAIAALAIYQLLWAAKITVSGRYVYILIICLILSEMGWAVSLLPVNYNIAGLVLAICYYILTGLAKLYLFGRLNGKIVKKYLLFGFASIFLVLLTARWV